MDFSLTPGPAFSAAEVTTIWRYTNVYIIIIIIIWASMVLTV